MFAQRISITSGEKRIEGTRSCDISEKSRLFARVHAASDLMRTMSSVRVSHFALFADSLLTAYSGALFDIAQLQASLADHIMHEMQAPLLNGSKGHTRTLAVRK